MIIRNLLVASFTLTAIAVGVACSSDDTSTSSSSSTGGTGTSSSTGGTGASSGSNTSSGGASGFKNCSTGTSNCTEAEAKPYSDCVLEKCDSTFKECYGPDYKSGTFAGACGAYVTCIQKCACNDLACFQACPLPDAACQTCSQKFVTCQDQCTKPACMNSSSSSSSSGGAGKTCDDLALCCAKISNADVKTVCQKAVTDDNDAACATLYPGYATQATGGCP